MEYRKDPMMGASRIITELREIVRSHSTAVGTVGRLETYPASINTIPGSVFFTVDTRHPNEKILMQINQDLKNIVNSVCSSEGLENEFTNISVNPTVDFNQDCVATVRQSADSLGYSHRDIVSGAGHDAFQVNHVAQRG
ncbi:MAG: hypothetical protein CM1200mP30_16330 [Pseudomonadota bacterium]|nr:MAG: hypothetical protein CM1200mP30_16330 [Pseudomonadota bacterium]